jgi:hypothetical protein
MRAAPLSSRIDRLLSDVDQLELSTGHDRSGGVCKPTRDAAACYSPELQGGGGDEKTAKAESRALELITARIDFAAIIYSSKF